MGRTRWTLPEALRWRFPMAPVGRLDPESSARLALLRFPLIVGVVFVHAYETEVDFPGGPLGVRSASALSRIFRDTLSQGIARIAVPLFFLLAGYFLFLGWDGSWAGYRRRLASRVWTLGVPYLFWNLATFAALFLAQSLPGLQSFFSGDNAPVAGRGIWDCVRLVLGIDGRPVSYQFWFIRDLMVLVVLSPLVFGVLKVAPRAFLAGVLALWFVGLSPVDIPSATSVAFFSAGAFFACFGLGFFGLDRFFAPMMGLYAVVLAADVWTKGQGLNDPIHRVGILLGMACSLSSTRFLVRWDPVRRFLAWSAGFSFFVFAVHEPLLTIGRKVAFRVLAPDTDLLILLLYVTVPTAAIVASVLLHLGLKAVAPGFLRIISGGR